MAAQSNMDSEHKEFTTVHVKIHHGVVLVPQPSDDPLDPLNWPLSKKILTLGIISLASYISIGQQLANQAGLFVQAALYHKKPVEISYSLSAAVIGSIVGPLIWTPVAQYVGRSSVIFWGTIVGVGCNIWSACMTPEDQYIAFVLSRWLAGLFTSASMTVGSGIILDVFFLHQRGKAFACYSVTTLFGALVAPVLSGFIAERVSWTIQFWCYVGALVVVAILVFFFLEDTTYDRQNSAVDRAKPSFLANRIATFFPGTKIVVSTHKASPWTVFSIALCPPVLVCGVALLLTFSWVVGLNTTLAVFLQTPVEQGGYGFTAQQNGEFIFAQWVSFLTAELYGLFLNDRAALWRCRRRGGIWKPEYRLFPLLIPPATALPIGMILFGVGLQYHLHYMVLATGLYLATFADMAIVPVLNNYMAECFTDYVMETYTALWVFRLSLGVLIPFFITEWVARNGPALAFGTMAILSVVGICLFFLLAWKGPLLRKYSFKKFINTEEGAKIVEVTQQEGEPQEGRKYERE